MRVLAWVLGAVATVLVVATTVTAVVVRDDGDRTRAAVDPGRPGDAGVPLYTPSDTTSPTPTPSAAASPFGAFEDEQVVYGDTEDNAQFEVPGGTAWQVRSADTLVGYQVGVAGEPGFEAEVVAGPAIFAAGYCPDPEFDSLSRAFVGFAPFSPGISAAKAAPIFAARWAEVMTDNAGRKPHVASRVETGTLELLNGDTAARADFDLTLSTPRTCEPAQVHYTVVSLDTGQGVASLVLVRDLGDPGVLDDETAETILSTLQPQL